MSARGEAVSGGTLVERLRRMSDMATTGNDLRDISRAADEIERLASQLSDMEAAKNDALTLANLREAEIERLRAALETIKRMKSQPIGDTGFSTGPLSHFNACQRIARAALARPPEPK